MITPTPIHALTLSEIPSFYHLFATILSSEFSEYSATVVKYLLGKMYTKEAFHYWLDNNLKTIYVVEQDSTMAGFVVIDGPYGGVSLCRWLGVLPQYQKKGLGSLLVQGWLRLAQSQGCHKAEVAVRPDVKSFYEKNGLICEGRRKKSYFGYDQYIFGKVIGEVHEENLLRY